MSGKNCTEKLSEAILIAVRKYFKENLPDKTFKKERSVIVQPAKNREHGDLATNVAMVLASESGKTPSELSLGLIPMIQAAVDETDFAVYIDKIEQKGGFINFRLSGRYYQDLLCMVMRDGGDFGRSGVGEGKKVNIEFVSANPTGPLTIAHGRQAAIGDALSRILSYCGYEVDDEYYLNDCGRQINLLGRSVAARYRGLFGGTVDMPEDGYMGGYIIDIAEEIKSLKGDRLLKEEPGAADFFSSYAVEYIMKLINKDLDDFRVKFDIWKSQASIENNDEVGKVLSHLEKDGYIYEDEGAKWFASSRFGDDKDRVVLKSDGSYTYLAPDIAYHNDKYERGYDRLIDLLGPDHHGYINRMKAAVQALGHKPETLDILIVQLVTLLRSGETVSMSTRKGEFISLREVIDEIGTDVSRFFFLTRKLDSHLDFDIDLAKKESSDNPVYYIQYAHARICSIHKFSIDKSGDTKLENADLGLLASTPEKDLMRKLGEFPTAVRQSAEALEPARIVAYLSELARGFHSFYTECRVVTDDKELTRARLFLVECVRIVLSNGLGLLNISLPEKM